MTRNFSLNRCLFMTVDPVHIGTGGYRLGRVDAAIAREPGTKLPKIPGTSLHGAARHYAAYRYNKIVPVKNGIAERNLPYLLYFWLC